MSRVFTVFGATGQQGGALLRYLLRNPSFASTYKLRCITRDVSKLSAIALREQGVEMVQVLTAFDFVEVYQANHVIRQI